MFRYGVILFFWTSSCLAGNLYSETGFGAGRMQKPSGLFGSSVGQTTKLGLGANGILAWNMLDENSFFTMHAGVKGRLISAPSPAATLNMLTAGGVLRFEVSRFYLGIGYSPLVWKSSGASGSLTNLSRKNSINASAYHGEFGILWRIIPDFSLAIEASAGRVSNAGSSGPNPDLIIAFQMRFVVLEGSKATKSARKYDGWRYPFGVPLKKIGD
jgi:hypothetical protein